MEAAGGIALMLCTVFALAWANSPWSAVYDSVWLTKVSIGIGEWALSKPVILWINDGLMAIFFFLVGLEIKRELLVGGLSTQSKVIMPVAAAIGGMTIPALLFVSFNVGHESADGWGIPMATDIAFALGVMSLLGKRVPIELKIFLTAVAIVDDIGAILIIAIFYTSSLNLLALGFGLLVLGLMVFLNLRWSIRSSIPYLALGIVVWFSFLNSGIHATIAGVLAAFTIPARVRMDCIECIENMWHATDALEAAFNREETVLTNKNQQRALYTIQHHLADATTPLQNIEHALHPWVAFGIMPLFALANAGVSLKTDFLLNLVSPLGLGIIVGLAVGKQVGVTGACWIMDKLGLGELPNKTTILHVWGASCLSGIGFTMSIFVTNLAFDDPVLIDNAKISILFVSLTSGILGYAVLKRLLPPKQY